MIVTVVLQKIIAKRKMIVMTQLFGAYSDGTSKYFTETS